MPRISPEPGRYKVEFEPSRLPMEASQRYKIRFKGPESMEASRKMELPVEFAVRAESKKRSVISVELRPQQPGVRAVAAESRALKMFEKEFGAEVSIDYQYSLEF